MLHEFDGLTTLWRGGSRTCNISICDLRLRWSGTKRSIRVVRSDAFVLLEQVQSISPYSLYSHLHDLSRIVKKTPYSLKKTRKKLSFGKRPTPKKTQDQPG